MPRALSEGCYNGMFDHIRECDQIHVVSDAAEPVDLANELVMGLMDSVDDYEVVAGTPNGWRLNVLGQPGLPIAVSDTARHIVLTADDGLGGREIRLVTPCTNRLITAGDFANVSQFYLQVDDPVEP